MFFIFIKAMKAINKQTVLFTETQYFRKLWFNIFMLVIWLVTAVPLYISEAPLTKQLAALGIMLGVWLFLFFLKLTIKVTADGLLISFWPFFSQKYIPFNQISPIKIHPISPLGDYGGWGLRMMPFTKERAYIMDGTMGATLTHNVNEKQYTFSLRDAEGFKRAIEQTGAAIA